MYPPSVIVPSLTATGFNNTSGAWTWPNPDHILLLDLEQALANMTAAMFWAGKLCVVKSIAQSNVHLRFSYEEVNMESTSLQKATLELSGRRSTASQL